MVVDDDMRLRAVLAEVLTDEGHTVRQAVNGEHALSLIRDQPPDLVLSDVSMPQLDGVALATTVAQDAPQVPVVLMSAVCPRQNTLPAPCLPKPIERERLLALVDDLLPV
jgi:CheY-like chemotaxis protein